MIHCHRIFYAPFKYLIVDEEIRPRIKDNPPLIFHPDKESSPVLETQYAKKGYQNRNVTNGEQMYGLKYEPG